MAIAKVINGLLADETVKEVKVKVKWTADRFAVKVDGKATSDALFSNKGGITFVADKTKTFVPWHEVSHVEWAV